MDGECLSQEYSTCDDADLVDSPYNFYSIEHDQETAEPDFWEPEDMLCDSEDGTNCNDLWGMDPISEDSADDENSDLWGMDPVSEDSAEDDGLWGMDSVSNNSDDDTNPIEVDIDEDSWFGDLLDEIEDIGPFDEPFEVDIEDFDFDSILDEFGPFDEPFELDSIDMQDLSDLADSLFEEGLPIENSESAPENTSSEGEERLWTIL